MFFLVLRTPFLSPLSFTLLSFLHSASLMAIHMVAVVVVVVVMVVMVILMVVLPPPPLQPMKNMVTHMVLAVAAGVGITVILIHTAGAAKLKSIMKHMRITTSGVRKLSVHLSFQS